MKRILRTASALCALATASCNVGPDWHPPHPASPATWGAERQDVPSVTVGGNVDAQWWHSFGDPELDRLVGRLAGENLDLQEAAERIQQGRAQVREAASQGLPHVDYQPQYQRFLYSSKGFLSQVEAAPNGKPTFDLFTNAVTSSWELDLFGRVRRNVEAMRANTEEAIEARNEVALSELSDLVSDYMQLRGVQTRTAITQRNLQLMQRNADLIRNQHLNGVATTLDVAQADAEVAAVAATLPPLATQQASLINAIGLLLAQPPRALETELATAAPIPVTPVTVPVGVPSELVRRRPDIRRAEAALHAATAETGVAVAQFYPDLTVMGSFGLQGLNFADAFDMPDREFTLGPTLDLPLFKGGQLTGQLHLRKSQQRQAAIAYRKTVLQAWTDVDDAMTAYAQAQAQHASMVQALTSDRDALGAAQQQYAQGAIDFLNVVTAENAVLQVENELAASDTAIDIDLVALYRALGGGWQGIAGAPPPPVKVLDVFKPDFISDK